MTQRKLMSSPICLGIAVWLVVLVSSASTPAQDAPDRIESSDRTESQSRAGVERAAAASARLVAIRQKIRALRVEATNRRKTQQQRLRELAAEKRLLERGLKQLRELSSERQSKFERLRLELQDKTVYRKALVERSGEIRAALASYLERVDERIQRGIPWKISSRQSAVRQVKEALTAESTTLSAAVSAASRIQSEQEALGRSVETGPIEVEHAGERLSVHAFHLGLLAVVFASDDGQVVGFAQAGQTLEQGIAAGADGAEAARGYLVAVDILRRRRTPSVVDLHLPVLPLARSSGAADNAEAED